MFLRPLANRGMAAGSAKGPLGFAIHQGENEIRDVKLRAETVGRIRCQVIACVEPPVVVNRDTATGMENGMVAELVAGRRQLSPPIGMLAEVATGRKVERGAQAVLL